MFREINIGIPEGQRIGPTLSRIAESTVDWNTGATIRARYQYGTSRSADTSAAYLSLTQGWRWKDEWIPCVGSRECACFCVKLVNFCTLSGLLRIRAKVSEGDRREIGHRSD